MSVLAVLFFLVSNPDPPHLSRSSSGIPQSVPFLTPLFGYLMYQSSLYIKDEGCAPPYVPFFTCDSNKNWTG